MQRILLMLLAALAALPATATAHGRLVALDVIDRDSGARLDVYRHDGQAYVEGRPGQRYAIRLVNRSGVRVLAVLSVDGINAVSGQDADPGQAGYVLEPHQSTDIAGWRKNLSEVAGFSFTSLPDSYAARTDRPDNAGVIGIAVFREKRPLPRPRPPQVSDGLAREAADGGAAANGQTMRQAAPMAQSIGTGHGPREHSHASRTTFARAGKQPAELVTLRYERRENLIALGVLPPRRTWPTQPQAFPGGFVPDP